MEEDKNIYFTEGKAKRSIYRNIFITFIIRETPSLLIRYVFKRIYFYICTYTYVYTLGCIFAHVFYSNKCLVKYFKYFRNI